jgi:hypothetical protein
MKYLFSTLFLVIISSVLLPDVIMSTNDNQLITEMRVVDNDTVFRYLYLYDDLGNKVLETKFYQQDSTWIRKSLNEWVYTGTKCNTQRERSWTTSGWQTTYTIDYEYLGDQLNFETHNIYTNGVPALSRKIDFQYDAATLKSKKEYSRQSNAWALQLETDFAYLQNGKTDSIKTINYQSGAINNQNLSTFAYNPDGTLNSQILQERVGQNWVNLEMMNWYYTPNTTAVASVRNKKWLPETIGWENTQIIYYQYDDQLDVLSETYQRWNTQFWENDLRYDYQYDTNHQLLNKTLSKQVYNDWRGLISINYSDFVNNKANTVESKYDFWGGTTGEFTTSYIPYVFNTEMTIQKGKSIHISYEPVTDTGLSTPGTGNALKFIPVYPNPSDGIFYINTGKYELKSWTVTDLNGQVVKSQVQSFISGVIDLTDVPKGIYILQVTTVNERLIQKLIKE